MATAKELRTPTKEAAHKLISTLQPTSIRLAEPSVTFDYEEGDEFKLDDISLIDLP